jgi:hypothetical protein
MQAWIIYHPELGAILGLRETEQQVMAAVEASAKAEILDDEEIHPSAAETLILVPEYDGDLLTIRVYRAAERGHPYLVRYARRFDSSWPLQDFDTD